MALPQMSLEKGLIHRSFLDNSISIFTSKRTNLFQQPSVSPDTVMFHSFLGTRKGCSATALAFSPKHSFLTVSLLGYLLQYSWASLVAQLVKNPPATWDTIPGLGRSPGEGKGYPLQYSGLENSMDRVVHGVAKSQTRLSDFHFATWISSFPYNCGIQIS